ncbi:MAG: hypothetical protein BWX59_02005 [Bacteroidetes bacterium ADurb.Bin028]|nr:MAG: hypothetical protein BWX59_02005 [Bacteroidetes bacterium ADurb.Bin028]
MLLSTSQIINELLIKYSPKAMRVLENFVFL